jgi:hypothetical protein
MSDTFPIHLERPAEHVDAEPGTRIVLRGVYRSSFDGSEIDAATTTWPDGAPGGGSVDAGGLVDLGAGGLRLVSRDPARHEVVAVVTDAPGRACEAAHVASPCIAIRSMAQARSRLLTTDEWARSLAGKITAEVVVPPPPPAYAPVTSALARPVVGAGALGTLLIGLFVVWSARRKRSPIGRLRATIRRIERKLRSADASLSATLAPAIVRADAALRSSRIDPGSKEGRRITEVLERVELRLDEAAAHHRAAKEQRAADELVIEMESALEAAREVMTVAESRP